MILISLYTKSIWLFVVVLFILELILWIEKEAEDKWASPSEVWEKRKKILHRIHHIANLVRWILFAGLMAALSTGQLAGL